MGKYLYSLVLELIATNTTTISLLRGDQTHALFLNLVDRFDAELAHRLHDEPEYRPFTVSLLKEGGKDLKPLTSIQAGRTYRLRLTLLDGGPLWQRLKMYFLQKEKFLLRLDTATFELARVLSSSESDPTGWADFTDWQTLAGMPASKTITLHFATPCAFSLGNRRFGLFPEPAFVWDSLVRTWNRYAPEILAIEKKALRECVEQHINVIDYQLETARVVYPELSQRGFVGTCTYQLKPGQPYASEVTTLAAFARYAGIGSKTARGMGQVRSIDLGKE